VQPKYPALLLSAIFLELFGGILFLFGYNLGTYALVRNPPAPVKVLSGLILCALHAEAQLAVTRLSSSADAALSSIVCGRRVDLGGQGGGSCS
jgi:hypothetical protein